MTQALEAGETDRPTREGLSALSGLAALGALVALLFVSTFIVPMEGTQAPHQPNSARPVFQADRAPVESLTFYLLDSDARVEEIRENVEFAAAQHAEIPPLYYPHAVILLAGASTKRRRPTPESSRAYAPAGCSN
jgi:hypothetical protein